MASSLEALLGLTERVTPEGQAFKGVLDKLPGMAGYFGAGDYMNRMADQSKIREKIQQQDQSMAVIKDVLQKSNGDPEPAIKALLATGDPAGVEMAYRLRALAPKPGLVPMGANGLYNQQTGEVISNPDVKTTNQPEIVKLQQYMDQLPQDHPARPAIQNRIDLLSNPKQGAETKLQHITDPNTGKMFTFDPTTGKLTPMNVPGQTQMGAPENIHGEDFLRTMDPSRANQVKALAEGRMQFPAGFALKAPYWQQMIADVSHYDPSFDAVNYNARSRMRIDAVSGKLGMSSNALNTGIGHLKQLSDAVEPLRNISGMPFATTINELKNKFARGQGDPAITNYEAIVNRVAPEITKIWRGAGGAEADIKRDIDSLSSSHSPEQIHGAISQIAGLMQSKLDANTQQYRQGMGTTEQNFDFVKPDAQKALEALANRARGTSVASPQGQWGIRKLP